MRRERNEEHIQQEEGTDQWECFLFTCISAMPVLFRAAEETPSVEERNGERMGPRGGRPGFGSGIYYPRGLRPTVQPLGAFVAPALNPGRKLMAFPSFGGIQAT